MSIFFKNLKKRLLIIPHQEICSCKKVSEVAFEFHSDQIQQKANLVNGETGLRGSR